MKCYPTEMIIPLFWMKTVPIINSSKTGMGVMPGETYVRTCVTCGLFLERTVSETTTKSGYLWSQRLGMIYPPVMENRQLNGQIINKKSIYPRYMLSDTRGQPIFLDGIVTMSTFPLAVCPLCCFTFPAYRNQSKFPFLLYVGGFILLCSILLRCTAPEH